MPDDRSAEHIGRLSEPALRALRTYVAPMVRAAFRPTLRGFDSLPRDRPFMLVANHSAGIAIAELLSLAVLLDERDPDLRLAGFAHIITFRFPGGADVHQHLGTVPSTYEAAFAALEAGASLLVFPGGDHDSLRPITEVNRVDFNGRKGFLRIAREAGVPIVPLGIRGSHWTAPILVRSRALASLFVAPRLLGLKRWGVSALGVAGGAVIARLPIPKVWRALLAWLWMGSPLSFLPVIPAQLHFAIGEPLENEELFPADADADADLAVAYARVVGEVQGLVDSLASARYPVPPK